MFRDEVLRPDWISDCAAYVNSIFTNQIKGKIVVDYAFGRGNWSLAFLKAGAKKVISIDASEDNVSRFGEYCREKSYKNIEVIKANLLEDDLRYEGDIVWLYGILHHIKEVELFLSRLHFLAKQDALVLAYYYPENSLRHWLVEAAREAVIYKSEEEFRKDWTLYTRVARLRARDDLTAPHIGWQSENEFSGLLGRNSVFKLKSIPDFFFFQEGCANQEFSPHQLLCRFSPGKSQEVHVSDPEPNSHFGHERKVLQAFSNSIFSASQISHEQKHRIAIGLFNTHFSSLNPRDSSECVVEDFLYLAGIIRFFNIKLESELESFYMNCLRLNLQGLQKTELFEPPSHLNEAISEKSCIYKILKERSVRI
jgi:2-polyprenyl-3-methyl-5-hydroxy-6-metoxy-1,4-benzoquinol methylase